MKYITYKHKPIQRGYYVLVQLQNQKDINIIQTKETLRGWSQMMSCAEGNMRGYISQIQVGLKSRLLGSTM